MPRKKKELVEDTNLVTDSTMPDVKVVFNKGVTPLELTGGLNVSREEFNQVVAKLNEVIEKVNK